MKKMSSQWKVIHSPFKTKPRHIDGSDREKWNGTVTLLETTWLVHETGAAVFLMLNMPSSTFLVQATPPRYTAVSFYSSSNWRDARPLRGV